VAPTPHGSCFSPPIAPATPEVRRSPPRCAPAQTCTSPASPPRPSEPQNPLAPSPHNLSAADLARLDRASPRGRADTHDRWGRRPAGPPPPTWPQPTQAAPATRASSRTLPRLTHFAPSHPTCRSPPGPPRRPRLVRHAALPCPPAQSWAHRARAGCCTSVRCAGCCHHPRNPPWKFLDRGFELNAGRASTTSRRGLPATTRTPASGVDPDARVS
jgi:hypothetical protein